MGVQGAKPLAGGSGGILPGGQVIPRISPFFYTRQMGIFSSFHTRLSLPEWLLWFVLHLQHL